MPALTLTPIRRRMLLAAVAVLVTSSLLLVTRTGSATSADGSLGYLTFKDLPNRSTLSAALHEAGADKGRFQFAVDDVGLFWPTNRATVEVKSDSSVIVRYEGAGYQDADATIDPTFGFHQRSGSLRDVTLRLEAQVNSDRITASAELWVDGTLYKLTDRRATPDADADLASILSAFEAQDWTAVYGWTYSGLRSSMTASEFAARSTEAFAAEGSVVDASRTGPLAYTGSRAGFDAATAPVTLSMSSGRTIIAKASLIWENDRWALLSIDPSS